MKKNREVVKPEIRLKDERSNIQGGVSKGNMILIGFVCLLVGFILGATVVILTTQPMVAPTPAPMVGPTKESVVFDKIEKDKPHQKDERK